MTTLTRKERRAQTLDAPRFERIRNPRSRRRLVAALVFLLVVEAGMFAMMDVNVVASLAGLAVVGAAFVLLLGALKASTRGVEELPEEVLDERQAQLRGRVFATAYRIGTLMLTLGLGVVGIWAMTGLPAPGDGVIAGALVVPFHVAIVLPTLVAAARQDV